MSVDSRSEAKAARRRAQWVQAQKAGRISAASVAARIRRILWDVVPGALLLLWLGGVLVRIFMQDRLQGFWAYYFYATPPIVLGVLATAAGLWWLIFRRWKLTVGPLVLGLACLVWAYQVTWFHNPPGTPAADTHRALFWNVAHGAFGWEKIVATIRQYDPDIVGLVESCGEIPPGVRETKALPAEMDKQAAAMEAFWHEHLPEYHAAVFGSGISLLVRGDVARAEFGYLSPNSITALGRYVHGEVSLDGQTLDVIVVDLAASAMDSRLPPLRDLNRLLDTLQDRSVLVMGDFNTTADSVYLRPLRRRFANAFEVAGSGYAATWPVPLPVLTIDHAWFNEGLRVDRCVLGWSWASDHRPMVVEFSVVAP